MILLFVGALFAGCNQKKEQEVIFENNFKLFKGTPAEDLALAVQDQDVKKIRTILNQQKVNVDFQEKRYGNTLLMVATMNNLNTSVDELLKHGANPNLRNKEQNESAFLLACSTNNYNCNVGIVEKMTYYGADLDSAQIFEEETDMGMHTTINNTPLMIAIESDCFETVKLLVAKGADINKYTYYEGYGAVTVALTDDNLEIAKYLIIDCKAKIPEYCYIRNEGQPDEQRLTIKQFLEEKVYDSGSENSRLRKQIIQYLEEHD